MNTLLIFIFILLGTIFSIDATRELNARYRSAKAEKEPLEEKVVEEITKDVRELMIEVNESIAKCAAKNFQLASLEGEWNLAYYRHQIKKNVVIYLEHSTQQGTNMLIGSMKEEGNERDYMIQLVQVETIGQKSILLSILLVGDILIRVPLLMVDVKPKLYFTVFQTGILLPQYIDWAIYTRPGVTLNDDQLAQAISGLGCLQMSDELETLLYPVGE